MSGRRVPPQAASLLDRTAWLLARHTAVWLDLAPETHDFLYAQPAPYNAFFGALDRALHEHGPVTLPALLAELRSTGAAHAAGAPGGPGDGDEADGADNSDASGLRALLDRLAGFHEVDDDDAPAALLEAVLRRLRQRAVKDELDWLFESGELSEEATARRNALIALTAELKNPAVVPAPGR